jgi:hypothetical protein
MRNILKITTFHTPIETLTTTEYRQHQIRNMISDFVMNSGEEFQITHTNKETYETLEYTHHDVSLSLTIKQDTHMSQYLMPHMILCVDLSNTHLEKSIIEDFLNTIVRFFSGILSDQYFIEYDSNYRIDDMNQGKKYSIKDIANIDMEELHNPGNKNLLDSLLYLHYTLQEQILSIGIAQHDIDVFLESPTVSSYLLHMVSLSQERTKIIAENLLTNIHILHQQIQILLTYFTHKI